MKKRLVVAIILGALSVILGFFLDDEDVRNWSKDELKVTKITLPTESSTSSR